MKETAEQSNTTSKIRSMLIEALKRAMKGELSMEDGRNVISLANQISQSMAVEVKVLTMKARTGHQVEKFGQLVVD